jgi:hypothetical protein
VGSPLDALDREGVTALRAAVAQRDVDALRAVLDGRDLDPVLQHVGDGLLAVPDDPLTGNCPIRLRGRGLEGDAELVEALEGRADDLRPLPVHLEELASIMEGDPVQGGGRLDLVAERSRTGRLTRTRTSPSRTIAGCGCTRFARRVKRHGGLRGHGVRQHPRRPTRTSAPRPSCVRRFRDGLSVPEELTRFRLFTDERRRWRARTWLAGRGLRPGS